MTTISKRITTSTLKPTSLSGNSPKNFMNEYKPIWLPSKQPPILVSTYTSTFLNNSSKKKRRNTWPLLIHSKDLPENKYRHLLPITTHIRKEMRSTTSGTASTFALRTKKIRRLL